MTRRWVRWGLRGAGLLLLAWVVATQVRWEDEVVRRADGQALVGRVRAVSEGYEVETGTGQTLRLAPDEVGRRELAGREVPAVTYGFRTLAGRLADAPGRVLLVLLVLAGLVALTGWRWHLLLSAVDLRLAPGRALRLTFVGGFFNMAVPGSTGGDVVKAWYAARETGAGTRAVLSVLVDRFVGLFGLVLFAGGVLWLARRGTGTEVARVLVLGVTAAVGVGAAVVLHRGVRRALGLSALVRRLPFQGVIEEARAAARLYRTRPLALAAAMAISLFNHGANAAAAWLIAGALGLGVDLGTCLALVPLANLLSAVPLLPGGWGVGELAFAWFFGQVGVPASEAVALSVVFRLATLAVNLPGGVLWALAPVHPGPARIQAEVARDRAPRDGPADGRAPGREAT